VLQDAADNLEAISDALDEMETLVTRAAAGAMWETEESIAQTRFDELLTEIDRRANLTTNGAVNLLANGSGTIAITLGHGNSVAARTIQAPKFDMTTQGLNLGSSLQLKGADTASRIDAAIVSVDNARGSITSILPRMNAAIRAVGSSADILSAAGTPITDVVDGQAVTETIRRQVTGSAGMSLTFQTDALSRAALDLLGVPTTTPRSETVLPWHASSLV
jgi:flagellin-like hook-associated protein FlgL